MVKPELIKPAPKKWMVVLKDAQYAWIKETSDKSEVSGAAVLRALISQAMDQNSAEFRRNLMGEQLKAELQVLEERKARIEEKEKELRTKLMVRTERDRVTA